MESRQKLMLGISVPVILLALGAILFFAMRGNQGQAVKVAPGASPPPGATQQDNENGGAPPEALKGP
jgi:hypothetical protein